MWVLPTVAALSDVVISSHRLAATPRSPLHLIRPHDGGVRDLAPRCRRDSRRRLRRTDGVAAHARLVERSSDRTHVVRTEAVASTAWRTSCVAASGCDTYETWEAGTSTMLAFARSAMNRWSAGGIALSSVPSRYQNGVPVRLVGGPDGPPNAAPRSPRSGLAKPRARNPRSCRARIWRSNPVASAQAPRTRTNDGVGSSV